jgi:hypothetical protein
MKKNKIIFTINMVWAICFSVNAEINNDLIFYLNSDSLIFRETVFKNKTVKKEDVISVGAIATKETTWLQFNLNSVSNRGYFNIRYGGSFGFYLFKDLSGRKDISGLELGVGGFLERNLFPYSSFFIETEYGIFLVSGLFKWGLKFGDEGDLFKFKIGFFQYLSGKAVFYKNDFGLLVNIGITID